jgi:hypothetical protein
VNAARLGLSLLLVALPAAALPAVRRTKRPRAWTSVLAVSLGAGFVLVEISLIHAALPLVFTLLGLDHLAEACRALGGHLFGDPTPFGVFAGLLAMLIGVNAYRGVTRSIRANSQLRLGASHGEVTAVGGQRAVFVPMGQRWAIAVPGGTPPVLLSTSLAGKLEQKELLAVVSHEMAHLEHHHLRFLLLGMAVSEGLSFLPWSRRSMTSLRLALERWADESASARSSEARAHVKSALRKLASMAPSALAGYRLTALEEDGLQTTGKHEWGWPTAASATVPLVLGLTVTLVLHLVKVTQMAGLG